jgi:hypothetical protein
MKIQINIQKRYFFGIVGMLLILGVVFGVYATIDSSSPNPGHNINELGGITCANGEAITRNASGWGCVAVSQGSGSGDVFIGTDYKMFISKNLVATVIAPGENYSYDPFYLGNTPGIWVYGSIKFNSDLSYSTRAFVQQSSNGAIHCDSGWVNGLAYCESTDSSYSAFFTLPFGKHQMPVLRGVGFSTYFQLNESCGQSPIDYPANDSVRKYENYPPYGQPRCW